MSRLVATLVFGHEPPIGGGVEPVALAHCYEDPIPRFLGYHVRESGDLDRVHGAYAPDLDADPSYPVTDLVLALAPGLSSIAGRIETLDTKAEANYGVGFTEKTFDTDVEAGSDAYGRHFEARSQLEAHPVEGVVACSTFGASEELRQAVDENVSRLDCRVVDAE